MDYFLLSEKTTNPLVVSGLDETMYQNHQSKDRFAALPRAIVAYTVYSQEIEIPDILSKPMFLVSDVLKDVMALYEPQISWKAIQVMPQSEHLITTAAPLYWAGDYPVQNCLHADSVFFSNGSIDQLILDQQKMRSQDLFQIGGMLEHRLVISLRLAESILRRNLYGIGLTPVAVR